MKRFFQLAIALLALLHLPALSCTTFVMQDSGRIYFGRNLDWSWEDGMVLVNPRNVQKRAFVLATNAATWTSRFGSVTFNQFGREMPFGGMNEAGLVIENMWLANTKYPPADSRPEINMLQWIQYQLDNHSNVTQVIESDKHIRLENTPLRARIHYLVCDAQGNSAAIEFLNGTMKVHTGKDLPFSALANDPYATSLAMAQKLSIDLTKPLTNGNSMPRFCRAAARAGAFKSAGDPQRYIAYAFETLEQVRQGDYTAWQMVYDVSARRIQFRTRSNPNLRSVDLTSLDFSCKQPVQFADLKASASGSLKFRDLKESALRSYLQKFAAQDTLKQTVGDVTPMLEGLLLTVRGYTCAEK